MNDTQEVTSPVLGPALNLWGQAGGWMVASLKSFHDFATSGRLNRSDPVGGRAKGTLQNSCQVPTSSPPETVRPFS